MFVDCLQIGVTVVVCFYGAVRAHADRTDRTAARLHRREVGVRTCGAGAAPQRIAEDPFAGIIAQCVAVRLRADRAAARQRVFDLIGIGALVRVVGGQIESERKGRWIR